VTTATTGHHATTETSATATDRATEIETDIEMIATTTCSTRGATHGATRVTMTEIDVIGTMTTAIVTAQGVQAAERWESRDSRSGSARL